MLAGAKLVWRLKGFNPQRWQLGNGQGGRVANGKTRVPLCKYLVHLGVVVSLTLRREAVNEVDTVLIPTLDGRLKGHIWIKLVALHSADAVQGVVAEINVLVKPRRKARRCVGG